MTSATLTYRPPLTGRPIRVVLADDNAAIRTLARHALSAGRGFSVAEAADGVEALAAVKSFKPDCVVLDIQMPRMGGFEALEQVRRQAPEIPVILLSGQPAEAVAEEAARRGAASYVDKSSSLTDLADAVRSVIAPTLAVPQTITEQAPSNVQPPARSDTPVHEVDEVDEVAALRAELTRLEYVVSHELGEPVRIMSGFSSLLRDRYAETLDDSAKTFLGHIADAASRQQAMLDALLAYSRAGRMTPHPAVVHLDSVVARAIDSVRAGAAGTTVIDAEPLPSVVADAAMLETVFRNLLSNAVTFNPSQPPRVTVRGRLDDGLAVISVIDNGLGVAAKDRERVFELFVRLHPREAYPGTGTGLALCRRLIAAQGGSIALESPPDGGTIVTLTLPAPASSAAASAPSGES